MTNLETWLIAFAFAVLFLLGPGYVQELKRTYVEVIDCSTPIKIGQALVDTVVIDHQPKVRCKK